MQDNFALKPEAGDFALGELITIETVSGLIPLLPDVDLAKITSGFLGFVQKDLNIKVCVGTISSTFPNSRGNISYFFDKPQFGMVIGGKVSDVTALRILFFIAHGVGHALQHLNIEKRRTFDLLIHSASSRIGSRSMEGLVDINGEAHHFKNAFSALEIEATRLGWLFIENFMKENYSSQQIEEVRYWYSLFGIVDHLYHRQSIRGPFPTDPPQWLSVFGCMLEAAMMPYTLNYWDNKNDKHYEDFECVYVGTDGWFYWAKDEVKHALGEMRRLFMQGNIDPFPRLAPLKSLPYFQDGAPFVGK